jgi:hypothetical protein
VKISAPTGQNEPYTWHIRIEDALALPDVRAEYPKATAILIDIKPSAKDSFVLCELLDVYGYSADEWTPMLWRMRVLANAGPKDNHLEDFDAPNDGAIIYNFVYAMGSVTDGVPSGKWTAPRPGSTNGVLLWPDALKYFMECIALLRTSNTIKFLVQRDDFVE